MMGGMDKPPCSFPGCDRPVNCRSLCSGHYYQWHAGKDLTPIDRTPRPVVCSVGGCGRPVSGLGLCIAHYTRFKTHGDVRADIPVRAKDESIEGAFWARVVKSDGCWEWTGSISRYGYGTIKMANRNRLVHRFAYELLVGPLPEGLTIDHTCHNEDATCPGGNCSHRRCVNPAHLEAVTRGENARRSRLSRTHCKYGHELTEENTLIRKNGSRQCRECNRRDCAERYARATSTSTP